MPQPWPGLLSELDPRLALLGAAVPSVISAVWIYIQHRAQRRDKQADRELTREQMRVKEMDQQQASFSSEQQRWFADLRQENRDLRADLTETRKDRDRGWDLARFWHAAAHDILRAFRFLRHNALNMMQWMESARRLYPGLDMPTSIEAVPDVPTLPLGLEDPRDV
jgi:hypothetical protein